MSVLMSRTRFRNDSPLKDVSIHSLNIGTRPSTFPGGRPRVLISSAPNARRLSVRTDVGFAGMGGTAFNGLSTTDLDFTSAMSVGALVYMYAAPGLGVYVNFLTRNTYTNETTNTGFSLAIRPADDSRPGWQFHLFNNWGAANYCLAHNGNLTKGLHYIVGTTDGTTRRLYVDGVQRATSTDASCASVGSNASTVFGNNTVSILTVLHGWAMRKVLPAADIARLWAGAQCEYAQILQSQRAGSSPLSALRHSFMAFSGGG